MSSFICKSLSPEVFWTALAAFGSVFAVLIALFGYVLRRLTRIRRVSNLIESEMRFNYNIIRNMVSNQDITLPGNNVIPWQQNIDSLVPHITLELWSQYRYQIASERPDIYKKYQDINLYAEAIVGSEKDPEPIKSLMRRDNAKSFVEKILNELRNVNSEK